MCFHLPGQQYNIKINIDYVDTYAKIFYGTTSLLETFLTRLFLTIHPKEQIKVVSRVMLMHIISNNKTISK